METWADLEQCEDGARWCCNDQKSRNERRDEMTMMQPCRVILVCIFEVRRKIRISEIK